MPRKTKRVSRRVVGKSKRAAVRGKHNPRSKVSANLPIYTVYINQAKHIPFGRTLEHLTVARREADRTGATWIAEMKDSRNRRFAYAVPSPSFGVDRLDTVLRTHHKMEDEANPSTTALRTPYEIGFSRGTVDRESGRRERTLDDMTFLARDHNRRWPDGIQLGADDWRQMYDGYEAGWKAAAGSDLQGLAWEVGRTGRMNPAGRRYKFPAPITGGYFYLRAKGLDSSGVHLEYEEGGVGYALTVEPDGLTVYPDRSPHSPVPSYVRQRAIEVADVQRGLRAIGANPAEYEDDLDETMSEDFDAEPMEPEEGDWVTEDYTTFREQGGRGVVRVPEGREWEAVLRLHMKREGFWPNVWQLSDHGNYELITSSVGNPRDDRPVDDAMVRELVLFIENDADLYRQQHSPINANLATKKARGVYDHNKAVKLFGYLVESGLKKYTREFGSGPWYEMAGMATRRAAAEELTQTFESEYETGNYDRLLPKKYQKQNPIGDFRPGIDRVSSFRPRFVHESQMAELANLWHLSRTHSNSRWERMQYTSKWFAKEHPELTATAVYKDLDAWLAFNRMGNPATRVGGTGFLARHLTMFTGMDEGSGSLSGKSVTVVGGHPVTILRQGAERGTKNRVLVTTDWMGDRVYGWVDKYDVQDDNPFRVPYEMNPTYSREPLYVTRRGDVEAHVVPGEFTFQGNTVQGFNVIFSGPSIGHDVAFRRTLAEAKAYADNYATERQSNPQDHATEMATAYDYGRRTGDARHDRDEARVRFVNDSYRKWLHLYADVKMRPQLEAEWRRGYTDTMGERGHNPAIHAGKPIIVSATGKVQAVKNLGWLLKNWKKVAMLRWESTNIPLHEGVFRADLKDGGAYTTAYADFGVFKHFINRPVFKGLPLNIDGHTVTVGSDEFRSYDDRGRRSNPANGAAALYEEFHGVPSESETVITEEIQYHGNLAELGTLVEIKVETLSGYKAVLGFESNPPLLCSSEDGKQLYIRGGDQSLDLAALHMNGDEWVRDSMVIGPITEFTYRTAKGFDGLKKIDYFHKAGEETGVRPDLIYDVLNNQLSVSGGQYEVKDIGVVN